MKWFAAVVTDLTLYRLDRRYGYHYHKVKYGLRWGSQQSHRYSNDMAKRLGPTLFPGDTSAEDIPADSPVVDVPVPAPPAAPVAGPSGSKRAVAREHQNKDSDAEDIDLTRTSESDSSTSEEDDDPDAVFADGLKKMFPGHSDSDP